MQNKRCFRSRISQLAGLLALVLLIGCADTTKRQAGKNLREDTAKARQLYSKANGLLSTPQVEDGEVTVLAEPEQAIKLLDQADQILSTTLAANYEDIKSQGADAPVSQTDAAAAYFVRGSVHQLASNYYSWKATHDIRRAREAVGKAQSLLMPIQRANAVAAGYQAAVAADDSDLAELRKRIEGEKDQAAAAVKATQAKIDEANAEIQKLQKQIESHSFKAATLRAESEQMPTEAGREKLKEAWTHQDAVHEANQRIAVLEEQLKQLKSTLGTAQLALNAAEGKLKGLDEVAEGRKTSREKNAEQLSVQKKTVSELTAQMTKAMEEAGQAADSVYRLMNQADTRLQEAQKFLNQAKELAPDSKQAQITAALADMKVSVGENNLDMAFLRNDLTDLTERINSVWEGISTAKPAAMSITTFNENTDRALEVALASYEEAIELQKDAVQAADRMQRWAFQRSLAAKYLSQADILVVAGMNEKAKGMLASAKQTAKEAIEAAPGNEADTMRDLEIAIEQRSQTLQ